MNVAGASFAVVNSNFAGNRAIGRGANPAQPGTPGGGSGGAIYADGNTYQLTLCGVNILGNSAQEGGGGVFFVSNNRTGNLTIQDSVLSANTSGKFQNFPGMFVLAQRTPALLNSLVQ